MPESQPQPEPEATHALGNKWKLVKGCGCTVALIGLGLGILVIGNFDSGAWASALGAIVIGVLVYNLSGINGFWER